MWRAGFIVRMQTHNNVYKLNCHASPLFVAIYITQTSSKVLVVAMFEIPLNWDYVIKLPEALQAIPDNAGKAILMRIWFVLKHAERVIRLE